MSKRHVLVIGSLNADLVAHAPRLPQPGETVIGASFHLVAGGKGANQAVAAARLGAAVAMVGRVGDDAFGALLRGELERAGVGIEHVTIDPTAPTGTGHLIVAADGQNAIVVASGANARVEPADLRDAAPVWDGVSLLVLQLEIPLPTVAAAIRTATARGIPVLLNAAPACPLPDELLADVTWLVVNEIELEQLLGRPAGSVAEAIEAATTLRRGEQHLVVTLGAAGAVLSGPATSLHVPAPLVDVVDTTAAGDAFVGALAAALDRGLATADAVRESVVAGSLACTKLGAIPSLPTRAELARVSR